MVEEEAIDEEIASSEDDFDLASAAPLAYNALLTLMKTDDQTDKPRRKKRKVVVSEDLDARDDLEDEDVAANEDQLLSQEVLEDDEQDFADPFEVHFNQTDAKILDIACLAAETKGWKQSIQDNNDGRSILFMPDVDNSATSTFRQEDPKSSQWHIKKRLQDSASQAIQKMKDHANFRHLQLMNNVYHYRDLIWTVKDFKEINQIRTAYVLHTLNHVFKTRDKILKNNAKLAAHPESDAEYRDQGFTRPKVLILLPTRNACLNVVNELIALSGAEQIENRKRFAEQFGTEGIDPLKNANKPDDFKALFAGNTDDAFRMGIKFTRKTIKLFAQFYGSDVIVASPLGLRMAIGDVGSKKRDWDYLSSIEVVILDGANAMAMQNWEHVDYCFEYLNNIPKESHGCDYGRVRNWALEEKSKNLRQTVFISDYEFPELRSLFSKMGNISGKVRSKYRLDGSISDVGISIRQTFQRFESADPTEDPDARFDFFTSTLLPRIKKLAQASDDSGAGCLLFVPSYFDFVRVRNYLTNLEMGFESISEYSTTSDLTRSRQIFASGRTPLLLMTERLHHYRRYEFKGVKNLFFYQVPEHAKYFVELVRCAAASGQAKADGEVRVAFSKWDEGRMERIVGTKRIGKMISGKDGTFEFV